MPALFNFDEVPHVDLGLAVPVPLCSLGKRSRAIELSQGLGCPYNAGGAACRHVPYFGKEFILKCLEPVPRRQYLALELFELWGNVPLTVDKGLFADVILRHF
ncbi:hypothetical protein SDC9_98751 [bioreactor metagenome]|uniref:Uncharacterized protein n=1 Tax=bioreactor metagenome TaxID=1076179 RepID=A0A645AH21_9ZZZZ